MTDPNGEFRFDFQLGKQPAAGQPGVPEPPAPAPQPTQPAQPARQAAQPVQPAVPQPTQPTMTPQSAVPPMQFPTTQPTAAGAAWTAAQPAVPMPPAPATQPMEATQAFDPLAEAVPQPPQPQSYAQPTQAMPAASAPQTVPATQPMEATQAFDPLAATEAYDPFGQPTVQMAAGQTAAMPAADQPTMAYGQPGQPTATQPTMAMGVAEQGTPEDEQATQVFQPLQTPTEPRPLAGTGVPPVIPPTGNGLGSVGDAADDGKPKKPMAKGKVAGIVVAMVVVIALIVGGVLWFRSASGKNAAESCTQSQQDWQAASKALTDKVNEAKQAADSATGQVADDKTISSLNSAINAANGIIVDSKVSCPADAATSDLESNAKVFATAARRAAEQTKTIDDALKNLDKSKATKTANDLKADLKNTIASAQSTLNASAGQVQDDTVRTALQDAISNANNVASQDKPSQADVDNAKSQLEKAVADVNASIQAKQEADAAAAEAQRQAEEEARRQAEQQQQDEQNEQDEQNGQGQNQDQQSAGNGDNAGTTPFTD
ncbi:hypothetical protein H7U32_07980 [Bifidobacterium pullorum subsp. saeculare]|uniref:Sugar-binding protein n=1 Tax=Bifidobacterium pullorum subsp. saeculare TaxID=78257 RepID=A0A938WZ06_9BIFI|nr:hypothetical protein [Bifidobacterium pullorum]MBM6700228.1 hypothetical protein [Bifidobacterium pullorum subsp. saeculare]